MTRIITNHRTARIAELFATALCFCCVAVAGLAGTPFSGVPGLAALAPAAALAATSGPPPVPSPSWWQGACDYNFDHTSHQTASWNGLIACGPGGTSRYENESGSPLSIEWEWECPELVKRYMYLEFHLPDLSANGNAVVSVYASYIANHPSASHLLTPVYPSTAGPSKLGPGDVISYSASTTNSVGHTGVITAVSVDGYGNGKYTVMSENAPGLATFNVSKWVPQGYPDKYNNIMPTVGWLHYTGSGTSHSVVAGLGDPGNDLPYANVDASGFFSLGGRGSTAPTVIGYQGHPYYIVTGGMDSTGNNLWIRSDTQIWVNLSTGWSCLDVGAVVQGQTLDVVCEGTDHHVWAASAQLPGPGQLPSPIPNSAWQWKSGYIPSGGGVAVGLVAGHVTYFATGNPATLSNGTPGNVWVTTSSFDSAALMPWVCKGHVAVGSNGQITYFACHGSDNAVWYGTNSGGGWSGAHSLAGIVFGGTPVGISVLSDGTATVYAEGTTQHVYMDARVAPSNPNGSGWTDLGGIVYGGVGAGSY